MATKLDNALEKLGQWVERNQAIMDLAEALKDIPSIDQAVAERKAALVTATAEHEAVKAQLEGKRQELAQAESDHAEALQANAAEALGVLETARASAASILDKAKADAKSIVTAANDEAGRVQAAHDASMVSARQELAATRAALAEASGNLDDAKAQHTAVTQQIEDLKRAAKTVLGQQ